MSLGTYRCHTLTEIIVRLTFAVECVTDMRSCSFVKFSMYIVTLEHFECDVLTRGLCRMWPNFGFFDHQMKVKVAEIPSPWGGRPPLHTHTGAAPKKHLVALKKLGLERLRDLLHYHTTWRQAGPRLYQRPTS